MMKIPQDSALSESTSNRTMLLQIGRQEFLFPPPHQYPSRHFLSGGSLFVNRAVVGGKEERKKLNGRTKLSF